MRFREISFLIALLCFGGNALAATPSLAEATAVLDQRTECVSFTWLPNPEGEKRGAITIPVSINGESYNFQLDTGPNATILYGAAADRAGWSGSDEESFRADRFSIGSTVLDRPAIYPNREMTGTEVAAGTLGLAELIGRIAVIDYPGQRFCLFADADLPDLLREGPNVRATLRNGKLFLPLTIGEFTTEAMVFDTGSSELPMLVDQPLWKRLTGLADIASAPRHVGGSSWGTPIKLSGAPGTGPMAIGDIELGVQDVFTIESQPDSFARWPFRADGVIGNAPIWAGIAVLDLTGRVRFSHFR